MTSRRRYRVGVLGLDHWYWATSLLPEIARSPRLELTAVWEPAAWRLAAMKVSAKRPARTPAEVTDADDVDVVVSLLPCPANARWLARAARHRKAVVANKPVAMTVAAARPLVAALRRSRRPSFSLEGHDLLSARHRLVRGILRRRSLGRVLAASVSLRGAMPQAWWDRGRRSGGSWWDDTGRRGRRQWGWWTDRRLVPGGGWMDHSIYAIASFRSLLNDRPRSVTAATANLAHPDMPGLEDWGIATYAYGGGVQVTMEVDWIGKAGGWTLIACERGVVRWGLGVERGRIEIETPRRTAEVAVPKRGGESVLAHLVRCLDAGRETAQPASLGAENLGIALAAYRAARLRRTVPVTGFARSGRIQSGRGAGVRACPRRSLRPADST